MAKTTALLAALALLSLALSGCTVRVDPEPPADGKLVRSSTTTTRTSHWSITNNGCTITDETPQKENAENVEIRESEEVAGPLAKTWSWKVENTSYESFRVRLHLGGPQELPYYHANQLKLSLAGGCGLRPHQSGANGNNLQVSVSSQPAGYVIDYEGKGVTTLGAWTLTVEAQEALLVYDVEILVDYPDN